MRSADLTEAQRNALNERLRAMLGYLHKLQRRMEQEHFPHDDPIYISTQNAYNAVHDLTVKVHYLGCRGTGRSK